MPESAATAIRPDTPAAISAHRDHLPTVCAVAALAFIFVDVLWEGLGHAGLALLTVSPMGIWSSIGWFSAYDSAGIDIGGAIVALIAAAILLILLPVVRASSPARLFLLLSSAFALLAGTGYLLCAALANFGDWSQLLQGLTAWNPQHALLTLLAALAYLAALRLVGRSFSRYLGVGRDQTPRLVRLLLSSWLSAMLVLGLSALRSPLAKREIFLSDFPVFIAAECGFLAVVLFLRRGDRPAENVDFIPRSWPWMAAAAALACLFIVFLGRGITLTR